MDRIYSLWLGRHRGHVRGFHLLYAGVAQRARTTNLDEVLEAFEADVRLAVAAAARRRVFVHAGVVGWCGRAIVLPGRSCGGKTTLAAAPVRAGATYYSDEYAVIDAQGRVHPFAKPLSVRDGSLIRKRPVEEFGGAVGTAPLPVGPISFSTYRPGAHWRPVPLSAGHGLLALISHTVPVRRRPRATLAALQKAVAVGSVFRGGRGQAEGAATWLLRYLDENAKGAA